MYVTFQVQLKKLLEHVLYIIGCPTFSVSLYNLLSKHWLTGAHEDVIAEKTV